jgi:uncharacterized protein (DUF58 family)
MAHDSHPAARVRFSAGFASRVARFAQLQAASRRTPREDFASSGARIGAGSGEFAGRRRYRPGDDLRAFDWEAFARGAGALVRLSRRESGERWSVLLDSSASMAVGAPRFAPKLQLAAELALAICAVGIASGGEVTLATQRGVRVLRSRLDFVRAFAELDGLACEGTAGLEPWFGHRALARVSRCILIGDLFDVDPARIGGLAARGRRLDAVAVLALVEQSPLACLPQAQEVEWRDPESGARFAARLADLDLARYSSALAMHQRHWRENLARSGGRLVLARAGDAFESHALRLLERTIR